MESLGHNLVVRNTFIDEIAPGEEDLSDLLARTSSDPTGGRSQRIVPLVRLPLKSQPVTLQEGTTAEEAGEEEPASSAEPPPGAPERGPGKEEVPPEGECMREPGDTRGDDEDGGEEDDDGDDAPITRTCAMSSMGSLEPTLKMQSIAAPTPKGGRDELQLGNGEVMRQIAGSKAPYASFIGGAHGPPLPPWSMQPPMSYFSTDISTSPELGWPRAADTGEKEDSGKSASSAPAAWWVPPPAVFLHAFHHEAAEMGSVTPDFRQFTKVGYEGRLSVVSESRIHTGGRHRYVVQFSGGELSRADGVGFIFSPRLPCAKNIQRIVSIFVNQRGQICIRVYADIARASSYVKPLELGDWVEMEVDLDSQVAVFNIWPCHTPPGWPFGRPTSTAEVAYGTKITKLGQGAQKQVRLNVGYLACVVKNVGVTVTLGS